MSSFYTRELYFILVIRSLGHTCIFCSLQMLTTKSKRMQMKRRIFCQKKKGNLNISYRTAAMWSAYLRTGVREPHNLAIQMVFCEFNT